MSLRVRKTLAYVLIVAGAGALWMGFAQQASAGEPHDDDTTFTHHEACTAHETLVNAQCVQVDTDLGELGVDDVVGDLTDSVDNLVDDLL